MPEPPPFPGAPRVGGYSFLNPCLLLRQAGQGGMGMVYEAFDVLRNQRVALKTCTNPAYSPRFYSEAIIGVGDFGEHVVQVLDIRAFQNTDYILMEWVAGTDLSRWTRDRILGDGQLIGVALQLCEGLARIHAGGIIHRDIKPANLMLTAEGLIKLADFGIAQTGDALHMPTTGPIGTQLFMSPEQREGRPVDGRSDIYSTGVTLYVMATGLLGRERSSHVRELLIRGLEPISGVAKRMDSALAEIIDRCIQARPEDRYASVEELLAALEPLADRAEGLLPTMAETEPELPPRDIVQQARTLMMGQNREDTPAVVLEPTLADDPADPQAPGSARAAAQPIPAVRPRTGGKPILVASLTVALAALVAAYAMTGDRARGSFSPDAEVAAGAPAASPGAGPTGSEAASPGDPPPSAEEAKAVEPVPPAAGEKRQAQPEPAPLAEPAVEQPADSSPDEMADETADATSDESAGQSTETSADPPTGPPQEDAPTLPALPGMDVHTDRHGRLAYVPQVELGSVAPRKMRFVPLDAPGLEGYLVQEVEVSSQLAAELGLPTPGDLDPCLPWDRVSAEQASDFVARLNKRIPQGQTYRFVLPSVELRQHVEKAAGDCAMRHSSEAPEQEETQDGHAPGTQAMAMARTDKVDEPRLWVPVGETGLYGLVGNVAELCRVPDAVNVDYRGGSAHDLVTPKAVIRSGDSLRATPTLRRAGLGLRLFLRLEPE